MHEFAVLLMHVLHNPDVSNSDECMSHFVLQLSAKNVDDRGLVTTTPKSKDILKEHQSYCDVEREVKHFPGQTLAYVTPVSLILDINICTFNFSG